MQRTSGTPIRGLQQAVGALFIGYGPEVAGGVEVEVVETFGAYEAEYAAIRKGAAAMDMPQKGVIEVRGGDRVDFLQRLLTQDVAGLAPGRWERAFSLNAKGRITADLAVLHFDEKTWLVLDRCDVAGLVGALEGYLFAEDVTVSDATATTAVIGLFGPGGWEVLERRFTGDLGVAPGVGSHRGVLLDGNECVVADDHLTGSGGLTIFVPDAAAATIYGAITGLVGGADGCADPAAEVTRPGFARPIGWLAFNTARIEAGEPIYHVDFGPDCLPHETGQVSRTVSFRKGCYVGQEVVARMENLGHPKRVLVGLRCGGEGIAVAGSQVFAGEREAGRADPGRVIGGVTSSTQSPMLGGTAVALAMVRWGSHEAGTTVFVPVGGSTVPARVCRGPLVDLR